MSEVVQKKAIRGKVIAKGDKTAKVVVERSFFHKKYLKRVRVHKNYLIHDPEDILKPGDNANFVECRPISKKKKWVVVSQAV